MNTDKYIPIAYLLLRLTSGWMFFQAGSTKFMGWFGGMPGANGQPAEFFTQVGIGGALEFFGGIMIMLGLFTRPVAFILSGEMAVAYWQFHAPGGTWPHQNGGVAAALYCFVFLFMAAYGGGKWSVDAMIREKRLKKTADI